MTKKVIPKHTLDINKYYNMKPGKTIVSYCESCRQQMLHCCIGSKQDGRAILYKFECVACKEKLNGINIREFV